MLPKRDRGHISAQCFSRKVPQDQGQGQGGDPLALLELNLSITCPTSFEPSVCCKHKHTVTVVKFTSGRPGTWPRTNVNGGSRRFPLYQMVYLVPVPGNTVAVD